LAARAARRAALKPYRKFSHRPVGPRQPVGHGRMSRVHVVTAAVQVDPDWLLSSTAQSAAALVAIVGGFLVSRLILLSTERTAALRRRQEVVARRRIKESEYNEVHSDRVGTSMRWFQDRFEDRIIEQRGQLNVDELLNAFIPRGSSKEEMRPFANTLVDMTSTAYSLIISKFGDGSLSIPGTARELSEQGIAIPPGGARIFEKVASKLRREYSTRVPVGLVATPDIVYQRQDALIQREEQLRIDVRALDSELEVINSHVRSVVDPKGVVGAVVALSYLSAVGIVLPTILMTLRPVPDSVVWRTIVVAAFTSGLMVLLLYFICTMRSLRLPDDDEV
jgi:hypothetical protein